MYETPQLIADDISIDDLVIWIVISMFIWW